MHHLNRREWLGGLWAQQTNDARNTLSAEQVSPTGALLNDATHKARIYLTAQVPMGKGKVTFSWVARYDSGSNYAASKNVAVGAAAYRTWLTTHLPDPGSNTLPSTYWNNLGLTGTSAEFYSGRGAFRYNDNYDIDFKLGYELPFGVGRTALIGDIKINNLLNHQRQLFWTTGFKGAGASDAINTPIQVSNTATFGTDSHLYTNYQAARSFSATIGLKF